jgi:uncharacterized protein YbjT (DUF2867 family)
MPRYRRPRSLLALAVGATLASCSGITGAAHEPTLVVLPVTDGRTAPTRARDHADVVAAEIVGDELRLRVQHGGGCRTDYRYALLFDGVFRESLPPQVDLRLAVDLRGDVCRGLVGRELTFDISSIRRAHQQGSGPSGTVHVFVIASGRGSAPPMPLEYSF